MSEPRLGRLVALVVVSGILMLLLGAGLALEVGAGSALHEGIDVPAASAAEISEYERLSNVQGLLIAILPGFAVGTVCALIATVTAFVWRATVRATQS